MEYTCKAGKPTSEAKECQGKRTAMTTNYMHFRKCGSLQLHTYVLYLCVCTVLIYKHLCIEIEYMYMCICTYMHWCIYHMSGHLSPSCIQHYSTRYCTLDVIHSQYHALLLDMFRKACSLPLEGFENSRGTLGWSNADASRQRILSKDLDLGISGTETMDLSAEKSLITWGDEQKQQKLSEGFLRWLKQPSSQAQKTKEAGAKGPLPREKIHHVSSLHVSYGEFGAYEIWFSDKRVFGISKNLAGKWHSQRLPIDMLFLLVYCHMLSPMLTHSPVAGRVIQSFLNLPVTLSWGLTHIHRKKQLRKGCLTDPHADATQQTHLKPAEKNLLIRKSQAGRHESFEQGLCVTTISSFQLFSKQMCKAL